MPQSVARQRGNVDGSDKQIGLRIKELERIYGIQHGGDRKSSSNNFNLKTQSDLAKDMNITVQTLNNYKLLTEMIPELEDLVDTGIVTKTTALAIMRNLSPEKMSAAITATPTIKTIRISMQQSQRIRSHPR